MKPPPISAINATVTVELHIASGWVGIKNLRGKPPRIFAPSGLPVLPKRAKAVCVIYSKRAVLRCASVYQKKIAPEWIYAQFPYGDKFNENTHVFGCEFISPAAAFMAAVPVAATDNAREVCESVGIKPVDIKRMDIIERLLLHKHMPGPGDKWVCFPLDNGLRVMILRGGLLADSFLLSGDTLYRASELARYNLPEEAVVYDGCGWLRDALFEARIKITEGGGVFETV